MPHMFTNRQRIHNLTQDSDALSAQFRWESINAVLYKVGGLTFIVGSVMFFPRYEAYADLGAWTFFVGSLMYLLVTGHDFLEVLAHQREEQLHTRENLLEWIAASSYLVGTVLFTVGSIFFLSTVGFFTAGAWFFIIGSLLFVLGACVNVLQIVQASSKVTLQLMNLTAVSFVVGSVLFTTASIPYLWHPESEAARETLYGFLAWQYLVGSVLFFAGGLFNYWRAYLVIKHASAVPG